MLQLFSSFSQGFVLQHCPPFLSSCDHLADSQRDMWNDLKFHEELNHWSDHDMWSGLKFSEELKFILFILFTK
jgi:hypothetical protein